MEMLHRDRSGGQGQTRPTSMRPGQLVATWQIVLGATWTAVFFALAATWKTSTEIGIGTWWLGPRSDPQPMLVRIIPFAIAVAVTLASIYNVRRVAVVSVAGSFALAGVAAFDIALSGGLAAIEFGIAACALLVSIGSFAGTYRLVPPEEADGRAFAAPTGPPLA